jgi:hypothetical protein
MDFIELEFESKSEAKVLRPVVKQSFEVVWARIEATGVFETTDCAVMQA